MYWYISHSISKYITNMDAFWNNTILLFKCFTNLAYPSLPPIWDLGFETWNLFRFPHAVSYCLNSKTGGSSPSEIRPVTNFYCNFFSILKILKILKVFKWYLPVVKQMNENSSILHIKFKSLCRTHKTRKDLKIHIQVVPLVNWKKFNSSATHF